MPGDEFEAIVAQLDGPSYEDEAQLRFAGYQALLVGTYYQTLRSSGVPKKAAAKLTRDWQDRAISEGEEEDA